MNRRTCSFRYLLESITTAALMGLSALVGMLALEYLVTGDFGAAKEYSFIALLITLSLVGLQWRRHRSRRMAGTDAVRHKPHVKRQLFDS